MYLVSFLDARDICVEQRVLNKEQVYTRLVEMICHNHKLPISCAKLLEMVFKRDEEAPTAYPSGIAIPHIRMDGFEDTVVAMALLQNPVEINEIKISWVALIITDKTSSKTYLNLVAALMKLSKDTNIMSTLASAHDGHAVIHLLKKLEITVKKDLCIEDIMIKDPVAITPGESLRELNRLMSLHNIAGLPVIDERGHYQGEVNILDLLKVGIPDYLMMLDNLNFLTSFEPLERLLDKQDELFVRDIMTSENQVLRPDASIIEAVFEMINHKKRYMSVVQDNKLVGLVTAMDVLKKVIQS